jgi:hypothetical protein
MVLRNEVNRESGIVSQSMIEVKYLRGDRLLPLAEFDEPESPWAVLSRSGGLVILELPPDQPPVIRTVDAMSGAVGERIALSVQPVAVGRVWMLAVVVAGAAAAAMLGYIVWRKREPKPAVAPKGD